MGDAQAVSVLRVAHEFKKTPSEIMTLPEIEFEAMVAFVQLTDEARQNA